MVVVEAVRRRFDPLAHVIPAHITLVFPFESEISARALRKHVESALIGVGPLQLGLGEVNVTDDQYLVFNVGHGAAAVADLHDRLYTGPLRQFLAADRAYLPHLTVGRLNTIAEARRALEAIASSNPRVDTIVSAVSVYRTGPNQGRAIEFEVPLA